MMLKNLFLMKKAEFGLDMKTLMLIFLVLLALIVTILAIRHGVMDKLAIQ